jgi:hypothetical protein
MEGVAVSRQTSQMKIGSVCPIATQFRSVEIRSTLGNGLLSSGSARQLPRSISRRVSFCDLKRIVDLDESEDRSKAKRNVWSIEALDAKVKPEDRGIPKATRDVFRREFEAARKAAPGGKSFVDRMVELADRKSKR